MSIKCIIFDLGNTLVDSTGAIKNIDEEYNLPIWKGFGFTGNMEEFKEAKRKTDRELEVIASQKKTPRDLWAMKLAENLGIKISKQQAEEDFKGFENYFRENVKLIPGAREILDFLKERGYNLALISNGWTDLANQIIDEVKIREYFDLILISEDVGYRKCELKPFYILLEKLKLKPDECIMVRDRLDEDACARKLGIKVVWFEFDENYVHPKPTEKFDFKIKKLEELEDLLSKIDK